MKDLDNYYIPNVEDLHIGMDVEFFEINEQNKGEWNSIKLTLDTMCYFISYNKKIRIKYLDRKDIESLGFEDNIEFYRNNQNSQIWIEDYTKNIFSIYNQIGEQVYKGIINNKSELTKLLNKTMIL